MILFVPQAVDAPIDLIRELLPSSANSMTFCQTLPVPHLAQGLESIFTGLASQVYVYKTLEAMDYRDLDAESTVISLTEHDRPVFKDITPERWYSFRRLFETERTVLWLTSGRLEDEPYSNMTIGFGRSAVHEEVDHRLRFLDIPDPSKIDARTIAETLVRFTAKELDGEDILYTIEQEIAWMLKGTSWCRD